MLQLRCRPGILRKQCSQKIFVKVQNVIRKITHQIVGISELVVEDCGFVRNCIVVIARDIGLIHRL